MRAFFSARPELAPTPCSPLNNLARKLGVRSVVAKDESGRFGLNAFKLLGARFTIETLLANGELGAGATLVCASEGNHGRAVARAAREAGCSSRVYMAADASQARVDAIAGEGADVIRVNGSYDDAVRMLQHEAAAHGWTIISDTSWAGYERIPFLIMLGYTRMLDEVRDQGAGIGDQASSNFFPDAIFVQGGVGGLLCAVASWCAFHQPACKVISVEPADAACLQASAQAGAAVAVTGPLRTAMAGLRNREVSPLAFESLLPNVSAFMAIDDVWAAESMRALHTAGIDAGASGAAALGGLLAISRDPAMSAARDTLGLDATANILVMVSEGVTDPAHWSGVVSGP